MSEFVPEEWGGETLINLRKQSAIMQISDEMLNGPSTRRPGHLEPPSAEEVAAYQAWKSKFSPLFKEGSRRGWFREGDEYDGFEYQPPESRWVFDD